MTDEIKPVGWNPFAIASTLEADFKVVVADLEAAKADIVSLQASVTSLTGGLLTAQTELNFIKQLLAGSGLVVPSVVVPSNPSSGNPPTKPEVKPAPAVKPAVSVTFKE